MLVGIEDCHPFPFSGLCSKEQTSPRPDAVDEGILVQEAVHGFLVHGAVSPGKKENRWEINAMSITLKCLLNCCQYSAEMKYAYSETESCVTNPVNRASAAAVAARHSREISRSNANMHDGDLFQTTDYGFIDSPLATRAAAASTQQQQQQQPHRPQLTAIPPLPAARTGGGRPSSRSDIFSGKEADCDLVYAWTY